MVNNSLVLFFSAALILIPTADVITITIGWRLAPVILAVVLLIIGVSITTLAWLLRQYYTVKDSEENVSRNEDKLQISTKRKIVLFLLWFILSVMKFYAYYTPAFLLVRILL